MFLFFPFLKRLSFLVWLKKRKVVLVIFFFLSFLFPSPYFFFFAFSTVMASTESMELPVNKDKKGPSGETIRKGFCFITFKDAESCDNATAKGKLKQELGDRSVDVKKAVPQEIHQGWGYYARFGGQPGGRGGRGGGGGGRGGRGGFYGPPMDPYMYGGYGYEGFGYGYGMDYGYSSGPANYGAMMPRGMPRGRGRGGGRPF